ncbi:MAG TPA: ADP-ribosylglycohydrolase family protein [Anaerovoracaceae bacterium]|nr:ADP-ribosylglycohydrolase family protein [Anaerovoracaceae bacterium]
MKHPNPNILLRIAQADAYAAATEYISLPDDKDIYYQALKLEGYGAHPRHKLAPGIYTDDTQMSIAVAEVLLSGIPFTAEKFANAFADCFHRDQRVGYSPGFYQFLLKNKTGEEFLKNIKPDSEKNGGAMRAPVVGVLKSPLQVLEVAKLQASLTHNTPVGIFTSQAAALMSHYALYEDGSLTELVDYCKKYLPAFKLFEEDFVGTVGHPHTALKTIHAVVHLLRTQKNLLGILKETIVLGGDTDSVAAIAWGIASSRMTEDLPEFFETCLEPGRKYGPEFLKALGNKLMDNL